MLNFGSDRPKVTSSIFFVLVQFPSPWVVQCPEESLQECFSNNSLTKCCWSASVCDHNVSYFMWYWKKNQQLVFTYLKSVFFNGLNILYVNKHVLRLMGREFTPNTAQTIFNSTSVETCSSKIRRQKQVLNTFCSHGWEMWHHFINGQRAGREMWGSGRGGMETPSNGYPMALPSGWCFIQSLTAQLGSRALGQAQLLQGLELWENRWVLVLLQNVPNPWFLTLGKSFELFCCQYSDCRVGWFVFNLILVDWDESYEESNFCVSG